MVNELFETGFVIELQDAIYGRKFRFVLEEKGPAQPFQTTPDSWLWCFWHKVDNSCLIMRAIDVISAVPLEDSWKTFSLEMLDGHFNIWLIIISPNELSPIQRPSTSIHPSTCVSNYLHSNSSICAPLDLSHSYLVFHSALLGSGGSCFTLAKPNMPYHRLQKMTLYCIAIHNYIFWFARSRFYLEIQNIWAVGLVSD